VDRLPPVAVFAVVTIAVTDPGDHANAILACLREKVGEVAPVDVREYEITLMGGDIRIGDAIERVKEALQECDPGWQECIAVSAPPGPG
jgi:hypothetical protein